MHFVPRHDRIRVLLIEDDEDDYLLTTSLLSEIKGQSYDVHWSKNYPTGLAAASQNEHDVCLVDYRLGAHDGIELMRSAGSGAALCRLFCSPARESTKSTFRR